MSPRVAALGCGALALACNGILGLQEPTIDDTIGGDGSTTTDAQDAAKDVITPPDAGDALLLAPGRIRHIAVDSTYVYFTTPQVPSSVGKVKKDGSEQPIVLGDDLVAGTIADEIVADDASIFWLTTHGIRQCAKTDCANVLALVSENSSYYPGGIGIDATTVYFVDSSNGSAIRSVAKGAALGTVSTLVAESALCPTVNAIVVTGGYVYFTCDEGPVGRAATSNGAVEIFATAPQSATRLAVGSQAVYYSENAMQGAVYSVPMVADAGSTAIANNAAYPFFVTVDATSLYWTDFGKAFDFSAGFVARCTLGSCDTSTTMIATNLHGPSDVRVDGAVAYYAVYGLSDNQGEGIYRVALP